MENNIVDKAIEDNAVRKAVRDNAVNKAIGATRQTEVTE